LIHRAAAFRPATVRGCDADFGATVAQLSVHKSAQFRTYARVRGDLSGSEASMITRSLLAAAGISIVGAVAASSSPAHAQGNVEAEMIGFHQLCDRGDKRACIRFGILIGENRQRHADWRRLHPDWWWWERP
jgi:hypothetical protein